VLALHTISWDPSLKATVETADGRQATAIEIQWEFLDHAKKYVKENDPTQSNVDVLQRWESVLASLEDDPNSLSAELDWVAKRRLVEAYRERDELSWDDPKLALIDLQYHDVRRAKGLYHRLLSSGVVQRLVSDDEVQRAMDHPPEDTRAYFRGECLRRFSSAIVAASWDALIFDTGEDPLRKVPTMEPTRGTKAHVQGLFDASPTVDSLIANLGA
jgi:Pup amidohydrolase